MLILHSAPAWSMFKSRLRNNGSIGFQRNNLLSNKANNSIRQANSLAFSLTPSSKWGINLNYSNYSLNQSRNYTLVRDTLSLEQFSNNINSNLFVNFGSKTPKKNISLSMAYMDLSEQLPQYNINPFR